MFLSAFFHASLRIYSLKSCNRLQELMLVGYSHFVDCSCMSINDLSVHLFFGLFKKFMNDKLHTGVQCIVCTFQYKV
jgi:hypothetical protein